MASAGARCNGGLIDLKLSNYNCDGGEFKLGRADATQRVHGENLLQCTGLWRILAFFKGRVCRLDAAGFPVTGTPGVAAAAVQLCFAHCRTCITMQRVTSTCNFHCSCSYVVTLSTVPW